MITVIPSITATRTMATPTSASVITVAGAADGVVAGAAAAAGTVVAAATAAVDATKLLLFNIMKRPRYPRPLL